MNEKSGAITAQSVIILLLVVVAGPLLPLLISGIRTHLHSGRHKYMTYMRKTGY
jgi:hypothetical protein